MPELKDLQQEIARIREERGFTTDPLRIFMLLNEEIGEIASELKRTWSPNYDEFDPSRLRDELADTFVLLCALATRFEVDLGEAVAAKFVVKDAKREWKSARS